MKNAHDGRRKKWFTERHFSNVVIGTGCIYRLIQKVNLLRDHITKCTYLKYLQQTQAL